MKNFLGDKMDEKHVIKITDDIIKTLAYLEVEGIIAIENGIEYDLHDYHKNNDEFERDIENLLYHLDINLPEGIDFSHRYSEKYSICGIAGEKVPDYHCYVRIYEKEV